MNSDTIQAALARNGSGQVTLRRPGPPDVDVACLAKVSGYQPHELVGTIVQGDRKVIISNSEIRDADWPGPPLKGDRVIIDGRPAMVQGCDSASLAGEVVKHTIQVRG